MVSEPGTGSEPVTGAEQWVSPVHETYADETSVWEVLQNQIKSAYAAGVATGRTQAAADLDVDVATRLFDAESALAELVRLKDGPRDAAYERDKPIAWSRARAVLAQIPEGTDHDT